ncbi:MAG TPA: hypothetical protein P5056_00695 [Candidatus Paceibacterota bacterium]|nr:hypothetical protein [Candidatus Paceibacterota bacterium]
MKKVIGFGLSLVPFVAFAQASTGVSGLITKFGAILNQLVPLFTGLAVVWLLWNIVNYIQAGGGDTKAREAARDAIVFSIILIFVMVSVWGLVGIIGETIGITDGGKAATPVELPSI